MEDGENILGKFGLGACVLVIENQDSSSVLVGKPFDEFEAEPREAVAVGNHNAELISLVKSFQYGEQSFALPVEASADVGDDVGIGELFLHELDLSEEVIFLFVGTDPAVTDGLGFVDVSEEGFDVVASLAGICFEGGDDTLVCVASEGVLVDA